jgi:hypothetical protein
VKNDYLKWGALLFALVATASAEYELARQVGFNEYVAAAVPGALDIYTVRAMRAHKDVLAAVGAMIGVNAASHLVTADLLPVNVPLVVAVSAIAPLVLWRVHRLTGDDTEISPNVVNIHDENDHPEEAPEGTAPEPVPAVPEVYPAPSNAVPEGARLLPIVARPEPVSKALVLASETAHDRAEVHAEYVPEPAPFDVEKAELGWAAEQFKEELLDGKVPGIHRIKSVCKVGQDRAKEIQDAFREALPQLTGAGVTS